MSAFVPVKVLLSAERSGRSPTGPRNVTVHSYRPFPNGPARSTETESNPERDSSDAARLSLETSNRRGSVTSPPYIKRKNPPKGVGVPPTVEIT